MIPTLPPTAAVQHDARRNRRRDIAFHVAWRKIRPMNTIATAGPLRTSASEAAGKACRVFASLAVALFTLQVHGTTPEPHGAQQPGTTQEQAANDGQIPAVWRPREL